VYPVSQQFLEAIRHSHSPIFYVDVWRGGVRQTPAEYQSYGLPISPGGTVTIDCGSQVRRQCSLTIADPALNPQAAQDLLSPYGTELAISRGIQYPNGTQEWVPLGWFRIDKAVASQAGQTGATGIQITGRDRSSYIAEDQFVTTVASSQATVVAEIRALVADAVPIHVPGMRDLTGDLTACPSQVYDGRDRAAAIATLATAIGAEFFFAADGTPTLRKIATPASAPAWTIDAGIAGVLIQADTSADRGLIFNGWVVTGERADGTAGAYALVTDTNVLSATYWSGPFGKKPGYFSSPVLTSTAMCTAVGTALLARSAAAGWTIDLTAIPNPALDGGDVIVAVLAEGRQQFHVVDNLTIPLDLAPPSPLKTRSNDPAGT
jgi:kumamolisin